MAKTYYRERSEQMLPYYGLWLECANEALANGWQFTRLVWGR